MTERLKTAPVATAAQVKSATVANCLKCRLKEEPSTATSGRAPGKTPVGAAHPGKAHRGTYRNEAKPIEGHPNYEI